MEWWQAIILGLVEGITEYLPISSTGHLIIASGLLGLNSPDQKSAIDAFNIVIQGGAILAVLGLYWPKVKDMVLGLLGKSPVGKRLAINIIVAFCPAAILGVLLDDLIEAHLFHLWPIAIALFVGGLFMILVEHLRKRAHASADHALIEPGRDISIDALTWKHALFIGSLQVLAMWPGTSRSMVTITAGYLVGLKPRHAAEFSFLLGLPTLGGATIYKLLKDLKEAHDTNTPNMIDQLGVLPLLLGLVVATIAAAVAIRWLVAFLTKHGLTPFAIYRIILAVALIALVTTHTINPF